MNEARQRDWIAVDIESAREFLGMYGLGGSVPETAAILYANWYTRPEPVTSKPSGPLVPAYRTSHAGSEHFDDGWTVHQHRDDLGAGALEAVRGREFRILAPVDFLRADGGLARPQPGTPILVTRRRDRLDAGYWLTWTEGWPQARREPIARLYWNVPCLRAVDFVAAWTGTALATLPHMMKILSEPEHFDRADAGVVYLRRADMPAAMPVVKSVHATLQHDLRPGRPPFARSMGQGLAFAEDPGGRHSFGEHRCQVIAEAVHANPEALSDNASFHAATVMAFEAAGIDPLAPYLSPAGVYPWTA